MLFINTKLTKKRHKIVCDLRVLWSSPKCFQLFAVATLVHSMKWDNAPQDAQLPEKKRLKTLRIQVMRGRAKDKDLSSAAVTKGYVILLYVNKLMCWGDAFL